jgi:formamidopyrimidine-DNA glycosylase
LFRDTLSRVPELPDITVYLEALERRVLGQTLNRAQVASPFLLRTATPPLEGLYGRRVIALRRLGKRIALGFDDDLWLVIHLMIAGRLHWLAAQPAVVNSAAHRSPETKPKRLAKPAKMAAKQAALEFSSGTLVLTEAGSKRRASVHLLQGAAALSALNPGGLEVIGCTAEDFAQVLTAQNHTLKRALTDPRLFSGIGNAYSDEILHRARLSPVALTQKLAAEQIERLHLETQETLGEWTQRLRAEAGDGFPESVPAFRPEMAVHGKFGKPCPVCGAKVQRIRYADNETNYCPRCQTGGKLLADRSLSRLLKRDWPKTPEELEELRAGARTS